MRIFARGSGTHVRNAQRGLTLIELLITLSILSLGALIAASSMNNALPQRALNFAAEQLVTDLKRVRLEAEKSGTPLTVRLDEDGYAVSDFIKRRFKNGITVSLGEESEEIVFQKSFASLGGMIVLEKGGRRARVAVRPITGKIERVE